MRNFINELNPPQQEAVKHFNGPSLVIAGAGAGKTRVLTYRVAYLLSQKIPAFSILALTFTNKAAKEMKDRIGNLVGFDNAKHLWMGTFHSIFARILRRESDKLGYPYNYTIYDTIDSKNLVKKIIKELNLDDKIYKYSEIYGKISWAKNNLITPPAYISNSQLTQRDSINRQPQIGEIYRIYFTRCYKAGAMDFDDLLLNTNILFRDFPETLAKYQEMFKYILVDEYQDTNYSQYLIIKKLAENHHNVCVVGDDAQSIYSFRGANIENILNFKVDYPDYKLFKLEQNYRSTKNIVNAANSIIAKNQGQIHKIVWSDNETGEKVKILKTLTDNEEGLVIANSIMELRLRDHYDYKNFAILYRTNAQSRIFEESLRKRNIPYKVYGGISFYQRKEIKDIIAYFRTVVNHNDNEALLRIINYPARGIGDHSIDTIEASANKNQVSIWEVITNPVAYRIELQNRILLKINSFVSLINEFTNDIKSKDAYESGFKIASAAGILRDLNEEKTHEGISRYENLQELLNGLKEYSLNYLEETGQQSSLVDYLETISLLTDADNEKPEDADKVTIMTIHSAKGLEFKIVYIAGSEEELFPSYLSVSNPKDLEEERRLFYVALTRAEKKVFVSYAESRYRWGQLTMCSPSRFIHEIDKEFVEIPSDFYPIRGQNYGQTENGTMDFMNRRINDLKVRYQSRREIPGKIPADIKNMISSRKKVSPDLLSSNNLQNFAFDDPDKIQVGMEVEHPRFGRGKVLNLEGSAPDVKAAIEFQNFGQKQLLLRFAKLRILN